jgi:hypothetical protein
LGGGPHPRTYADDSPKDDDLSPQRLDHAVFVRIRYLVDRKSMSESHRRESRG